MILSIAILTIVYYFRCQKINERGGVTAHVFGDLQVAGLWSLPPAGEGRLGGFAERVRVFLLFRRAGTPSPGALARLSPLPQAGEGFIYCWGLGPKAPAAGGAASGYPSPGPAVPALDLSCKGRG